MGRAARARGTVGQRLAERLGWHFLDSGALYRALGIAASRLGEAMLQDADALARLAENLDIRFVPQPGDVPVRVILNGTDMGDTIRTEDSGRLASLVAAVPQALRRCCRNNTPFVGRRGWSPTGATWAPPYSPMPYLRYS